MTANTPPGCTGKLTPLRPALILELPDKILLRILDLIRDGQCARNFSKSCRRLYRLAGPRKHEEVRLGAERDVFLLSNLLWQDDGHKDRVRHLIIAPLRGHHIQNFELMERLVEELPKLQSLFVRYPPGLGGMAVAENIVPSPRWTLDSSTERPQPGRLMCLRSCKCSSPLPEFMDDESLL